MVNTSPSLQDSPKIKLSYSKLVIHDGRPTSQAVPYCDFTLTVERGEAYETFNVSVGSESHIIMCRADRSGDWCQGIEQVSQQLSPWLKHLSSNDLLQDRLAHQWILLHLELMEQWVNDDSLSLIHILDQLVGY